MKIHLRRILALLAGVLLLFFGAGLTAAQASSPHFKPGGSPVCTVTYSSGGTSATTTCTATMAGLGNADVQVDLSTSGTAVYQCQNGGGNVAPGQNKVLIGPAPSQPLVIPASAVKNGTLTFTSNPSVLTAPATVSGAQAGCPNPNWTGVNPVVSVTSITLTIEQPPGTTIFTCTASGTKLSGTVALTC